MNLHQLQEAISTWKVSRRVKDTIMAYMEVGLPHPLHAPKRKSMTHETPEYVWGRAKRSTR